MSVQDLASFDPELLLQELRARESRSSGEHARSDAFGASGAKRGRDGRAESVPSLESYGTEEITKAVRDAQRVIYGTDDRQDIYEIGDPSLLTDTASVVALLDASDIADNGDGTATLNGDLLGDRYNLCADEPFRDQPTIAFCTGFLVDPSLVATAAHCVDVGSLASVRFVFGYEMSSPTTAVTRISTTEIYRAIRIIGREIGTEGTDWAVVQLDRPVPNHPFVRIRRTGKIADAAGVHVIGHPSGLPKKHAGNATVRDNAPARFFSANLDTYGGNSGSPVFNTATHEVEGILVRGETDYVSNGACTVSNICPVNGCRGEDCTRTTEFARLVPENQLDCIPFDLAQARVEEIGGRWKITVGSMWLLDFGNEQPEADQALRVLQHYGMNGQCFVGRPHPSMEFYLVNGTAPQGTMPGEDAIPFDPSQIEVQKVRDRWKIVEGSHWLMDFDQEEGEARQALSHILRYGFTHVCFVGRPDPSMAYFRR